MGEKTYENDKEHIAEEKAEIKTYEYDNDYLLDVLELKEGELLEKICPKVPEEIRYDFSTFLAVTNAKEKILISKIKKI